MQKRAVTADFETDHLHSNTTYAVKLQERSLGLVEEWAALAMEGKQEALHIR